MNKKEIKQQLDRFYNEHYNQLIEIATIFSNQTDAIDLVNTLYMTIINAKTNKGISNAIQTDNLFNFIFVALRNQARGYTTEFNKLKIKDRIDTDVSTLSIQDEPYSPSIEEQQWLIITKELYNLKKTNKITDYEYNLFNLYYNFEEIVDIKGLTKKETTKIRKMSLRRLAKETTIGHLTIYLTVKKVLNILKNQPIVKQLINKNKINI